MTNDIRTGGFRTSGMSLEENLLTDQTVSGLVRWRDLDSGSHTELGNLSLRQAAWQARKYVSSKPTREKPQVPHHKGESIGAEHRDGAARSSDEACESRWSEGAASPCLSVGQLE